MRTIRRGIRSAARNLDKKLKINTTDHAVFLLHGERGHMVPNQYWVPGMFSPCPSWVNISSNTARIFTTI